MKSNLKIAITALLLGVVIITGSKGSKGQGVTVEFPANKMVQSKVYPNPSAGQVNIAVENLPAGTIELKLIDMNGKEWLSKTIEHTEEGAFHESIDAEDIPDGIYKLKIVQDQFVLVRKWTKGL